MEKEFKEELEKMIETQLVKRGITDERVLNAIRKTPRHLFVPEDSKHLAYEDHPLSIGYNQTISQPYIVALMTQLLDPKDTDKVLEIGTGSGWQAGILSFLCKEVYTVERIPELADFAKNNLEKLNIRNVHIFVKDGTKGLEEFSPYDKIIVTCAAPQIPKILIEQLKLKGKMVIPVGSFYSQELMLVRKIASEKVEKEVVCGCVFVPMIGEYGFKE